MSRHRSYHNAPFVDGKPGWEPRFLELLEETGRVQQSAERAGVCRQTVYERRRSVAAFASDWASALKRHHGT